MKISTIQKVGKAIVHGAWVGNIPGLPGVELYVRGQASPEARRVAAEAIAAMPRTGRTQEDFQRVERRQILDAILIGWRGIEGDDGQPLEYSRAEAEKLFADADTAVVLTEAVNWASQQVAESITKDVEEAVKN